MSSNVCYKHDISQKPLEKLCPKCQRWKTLDGFGLRSGRPGCWNSYCIPCNRTKGRLSARRNSETLRAYKYRTRYGITIQEYEQFVVDQKGCCAICSATPKRLVVDHDHLTGRVRGLLCNACNVLLGCADDSKIILQSALRYIRE